MLKMEKKSQSGSTSILAMFGKLKNVLMQFEAPSRLVFYEPTIQPYVPNPRPLLKLHVGHFKTYNVHLREYPNV